LRVISSQSIARKGAKNAKKRITRGVESEVEKKSGGGRRPPPLTRRGSYR
jgi:hypothetical protein